MVLKISRLLRTALQYGSADLVCLDDELKFVEDYLDLEKTRFEERLDVRWEIGPDTRQILVPQLILQPLVENAILHGVACCRSGGWIEILTRRTNRSLEIHIRNSAGGKRQEGTGVGLENTKARLNASYSDEAGLFFDIGRDGVVVATLVIPAIGAQRLIRCAPAPDVARSIQMGA